MINRNELILNSSMSYTPKEDHFFINLYVNEDRLVLMGNLDNNFCIWLSVGEIREFRKLGESITAVISLRKSIRVGEMEYNALREMFQLDRYKLHEEFMNYRMVFDSGKLKINGNILEECSSEQIQLLLNELYEKDYESLKSVMETYNPYDLLKYLRELETYFQYTFDTFKEAAYSRTNKEREEFDSVLEDNRLNSNSEVRRLINKCNRLVSNMYNCYMTYVR